MKKIITLVFMSAVLALTSCNDFLDKYPKYGGTALAQHTLAATYLY